MTYRLRYSPFKRLFDIAFSLSFLLIFSPLYCALALLVKATSKGPILYKGKRVGQGKKVIEIYKFRTMYPLAEGDLKGLLSRHPLMEKEWEVYQKLRKDPRCTPVGNWMRKTSLDELPQFFSVLKGDLSVVGPRPHYLSELAPDARSSFRKQADTILSVKPGITSIWQISGRSRLSYEERIRLDCAYVDRCSFLYDLSIILKTIPTLLRMRGAH